MDWQKYYNTYPIYTNVLRTLSLHLLIFKNDCLFLSFLASVRSAYVFKIICTAFTYIKSLVWHSHIFLLACIIVEKYFIVSTSFIFDLFFSMLCSWWIICFYIYWLEFVTLFSIFLLSAAAFIKFLQLNDSICLPDKTVGNETNIHDNYIKFWIKACLFVRGTIDPSTSHLNTLLTWIK